MLADPIPAQDLNIYGKAELPWDRVVKAMEAGIGRPETSAGGPKINGSRSSQFIAGLAAHVHADEWKVPGIPALSAKPGGRPNRLEPSYQPTG
ncbi:MAG: pyridoxamine 5-phosphate oxidase family protein [Nocardia sp.]|uniref:hypothetical protein n=1 Tax=Nocardia sp. TaxID=1821 RepID=UPI00260E500C|nr:hypothetical protein [Nocardia sp.]MCU1642899.1 pyridoxamine 5-phosphate oxidase family protein [Nocardia sp.]